jgi:PAS domain S-box-containing protein
MPKLPAPTANPAPVDSEENFRRLVESVTDYAIFILDPTGYVRTWNLGAERIKGYRAAEIIGQHFSRFYPPDAIASGWPQYELDTAARDGRFEDEGWRLRQDGSRFWANVVITALRDASGTLVGFAKVTRDLTERRNAEQELLRAKEDLERRVVERTAALQADRERLKTTLASIGDAAIATDMDGRITLINAVAQGLTGWSEADAVGRPIGEVFRIISEVTRQPAADPVARVLESGAIVGLANHTVLIAKDGSERPIDDTAAPIKSADGPLLGVVLIFRDISERRRAEELALRLAAIVASSQDAIISKTLDGIVTSWNKGAEQLYGYCADEMVGHPIAVLIPPEHPDELPSIMERLRRGEPVEHYDAVRVRRDGTRVVVSLAISPMRTADGRLIGASVVARNISERKAAEQLRVQLIEELQESDQRKNRFLAMLAHELRNPLAPIRNALQVLRAPGATLTDQRAARDMMERQLQHLARLVDDLLDVSRIMLDRIELRRERVDMAVIFDRAVETARPLIDARHHTLSVVLPPQPLALDVDVVRISQAISNLLLNAAKYTDAGGRIVLAAERGDGTAIIRVHDTGIGIAPEVLPRIFELFTQADQSLDRAESGLGIGLSLARKLIELHGGTVRADSAGIGRGSEFTIRLPVATDGDAWHAPAAGASRTAPPPQPRRVLVVDDNVDAAESSALLLRLSGHHVETAHDGPAALERVATFHPSIVLLDIGLPGLDGYEVARRLRSIPDNRSLLLVAITGYGQLSDKERAHAAGFDHHLTKPIDPALLEALVADPGSFQGAPRSRQQT